MTRYELRQVARVVYDAAVVTTDILCALVLAREHQLDGDMDKATEYMEMANKLLSELHAARDALARDDRR